MTKNSVSNPRVTGHQFAFSLHFPTGQCFSLSILSLCLKPATFATTLFVKLLTCSNVRVHIASVNFLGQTRGNC